MQTLDKSGKQCCMKEYLTKHVKSVTADDALFVCSI